MKVEAESGGYTYKTVARKVMAVRLSASSNPEDSKVYDPLEMTELLQWMPDEEEYLKPLESMSCADARMNFAMPVPWISCFACYMGTLKPSQVTLLKQATSEKILHAIEKFRMKNDFAPSIKTIAELLTTGLGHGNRLRGVSK